jgi:hypothetical protein
MATEQPAHYLSTWIVCVRHGLDRPAVRF